ncbi:hypothetical protein GCM10022409_19720 [Hymenobacter glaciei]|uniref:Fibronectin type-III domain-containing protein n=1 Tax=Hymenobacter glaciei TaxID=877209 RepID=A0ABP7U3G6_9BACT
MALLLLWALSMVPRSGQAQVYYTLNDGSPTTLTDQLRSVAAAGTGDALIKDNFVQTAGPLVLDAANNRLLVADTRVSQASTSLTNTKIVAVSLAAGNAVTTLITPAYITNSTSTVVSGLDIDRTNNYLYYTLNDGSPTTLTDQLRRVNLDGTNDILIKDNFVQTAGPLVLDAANNRVLVADTRVSQASTSLTNTKIVAVSLAAGNAVTTLITPAYITNSISTVVGDLAIDRTNNYLYYTLNDGSPTTLTDQLRRVNLDGTNDILIKDNFVQTAGPLVLDAANNRVLVADTRVSQASTSLTNTKIVAVSLAAGNAVTTLITPAYITNSTSTVVAGLAVLEATAATVTTAAATSITSTSAVLGGNVTADGGATVSDRGVVYSTTNTTPAIGGSGVTQNSNGTGSGTFLETISGLTPGTTYYVRAYAINSAGTSYGGSVVSFTTLALPTVTTALASSITTSSAVLGGNVTADGGATITDRGVVYSITNTTPTTADTKAANGSGVGSFAATISSLTPGTTYYVRAYATNSAGTGYGSVVSFTTTPNAPVVNTPANGSLVNTTTPTYMGTALAGSTVTVYVDGSSIGTTTATGGSFSLSQPTALSQGSHTVYATAQASGSAVSANSASNTFTVDTMRPITTITSTTGASGSTSSNATFAYTVTFSEAVTGFVAGDVSVTNGAISGFAGSGTTYTFNVTPAANGAVTVNVPANVASDAAGNLNTAATQYSITYAAPNATVVSVTGLTPSPTATATVNYQVTFSASVTGVTTSNFSLTTTGISGASVASVSGSGTTYTVTVNTGTGDGTLRLNVANATGISPTVTNTPFTSGTMYTITKSFAASPTLSVQGTGSPSGSPDVTAFLDVVQVLSGGSPVANALQNPSFETHNPLANGNYGYNPTGGSWTFNSLSGIAEAGSAFTPITPVPNGIAVAFVQSNAGSNGQLQQNLALPTGSSYQVSFQAAQRNCCSATLDQGLNVFLNGVFIGTIQPPNNNLYSTFTSATFAVTAPALIATIASATAANGGSTGTSPIAYTVTFSQSVGTSFTASDVSVTNGAISGFAGSGTTYTFNVTPAANGAVTVNVAANVAQDANNTGNTAATPYSITYTQPVTAAPVVTAPANGSLLNTTTPNYAGTAVAGSTVTVYVDGTSIGTTTADASGNFTLAQPTGLAQGSHTVYATAQSAGSAVSANSPTNTFTVDSVRPAVDITSSTATNGSTSSNATFAYTVTFTEPVSGFVAGDVSVGNGTLTGFTAVSGTTYTFNVTPTANGAVTVNVPANVAQDAAANFNTAATQYSITYQPTTTSWTGLVSTDWFTAGNWSAGVPTSTVDAIVPASAPRMPSITASTATTKALTLDAGSTLTQTGGTLDVRADLTNNGTISAPGGTVALGATALASVLGSSNTRFWNLTVGASGAQLSTSASTSVQRLFTLNGALTTNGNPLMLESNATNTALVVNTSTANVIVGNVTVQRYIAPDLNAGLGYRHYSAPVSTATVGSLAIPGSFTPVVNGAYNTSATPKAETPFPTVYFYDQARLATATNNLAPFDKGWTSPTSLGDPLTVGKGYTVNVAANQTLSVTGPQNNGTVTQTLSRNSGATAFDAGWQLVGNPYPSPLDYSLIPPVDRIGLDAAIYVFESSSQYNGTYRSYVNGVGGNPVLAQGQGFFTRVSNGQTSGNLTLRNSQRVTAYQNPVYHRTAETRPLVQLDLHSATGTDPVYVYFENGATAGIDREFDAVKLPNSTGLNVSAETSAQRLAVNGLPTLGTAPVTVPLTVGVPAAGSYRFDAAQLLNLSTTPVYLRDLQTGAVVDLARQPSYSFVVSNASALVSGRFELVFSPQAPLATVPAALAAQVGVYPNPATTTAFVELPAALGRVAVAAELVDGLGRTVRTQSLPAQGAAAHRLDLANLATGVYTLHLNTSAGVVVKKLVVQ